VLAKRLGGRPRGVALTVQTVSHATKGNCRRAARSWVTLRIGDAREEA
jgi:hypothetical protein